MATVGDIMIATLKASGVSRIYGLPGDALNGFTDALRRDGTISWQHVRHEEAAAFAASGEAAVTGELAVCAASCGPGNLHLINGLFDATRSRVPVLAIAAHIPREEIGGGYFQETHPQELFRECTVYVELVSVVEQLPRLLEIAMRTALERGGAAMLVIPAEIFLADAGSAKPTAIRPTRSTVLPDEQGLRDAVDLLNSASRVTILAGAGCRDAHDEVIALADRLKAPIVHALRGKEFIEYDNPFDVGMTGLLGFSSGYRAIEHSDVLLMLGTDFPYRPFYPPEARVIQVDVRGEAIGRRTPVDIALVGTVKETIRRLAEGIDGGDRHRDHLDEMTAHYTRTRSKLDKLSVQSPKAGEIHPEVLLRAVDEAASEDAVFIPDVGTITVWVARYLRMNGHRKLIGSFVHGSMANALPHAIGVQSSQPGRQVIALCGDGSLTMTLGELLTLRQLQLPVKLIVFDNRALGFVELEMKAGGIVNWGTDLDNPDLAAVGASIGLHAVRVEHPDALQDALTKAFAHPGPALVDVSVARQELSVPPTITAAQTKGFALWATRTVLSGGADQLVELARTNLRQLRVE
jgi:pyruvate dehydrogenase (quinone)